MEGKIFLSYRRVDAEWFATALYLRLGQSFPAADLFMDVEGIEAGRDFVEVIEDQVRACDAMLVLIGPKWLTASDDAGRRRLDSPEDFVRIEVESAPRYGKRVIPVLVPKTEMPRVEALPEPLKPLAQRQTVRLTHERFTDDTQSLIKVLAAALVEAEAARHNAATEAIAAAGEQTARAVEVERRRQQAMPSSYRWWWVGLNRASSVCAIRQRLGQRFGSGLLVRAGDFGLRAHNELMVLTNFHVINKESDFYALTPENAEVAFEASDASRAWWVESILWQSPPDRHDASVLRLQSEVTGVAPLLSLLKNMFAYSQEIETAEKPAG